MLPRGTTGKTRGQNGVASPFLWGSCIPYNVPVYPGALCPRNSRTEDAPELMCFAGEMRQVFVNLIGNAIESMPGGGQLKVRVRPGTDWRTDDHGVRVTIADTGKGMSIDTRKHIYEAFFTPKGSQGSGLGLWVTSNIVKKHQGCIHVRSRRLPKAGGTLFNLVFPYRGAEGKAAGFRGTPDD